jgi:catechol 2,3-dioxygenase-like lactoylglutathione lyase family enzyme
MRLGRLVLYVRDVEATIGFYERHFGYVAERLDGDRIIELVAPDGAANLMIHPAGKGQKMGQALVKLVFDVRNVEAFCIESRAKGLEFGSIHQADGYQFANARDPSGNSISVSNRAFRT